MIAGLTGGIGSGKSVVAKLLGIMGCAVFDSDAAGRAAYFDKDVPQRVKSLLGDEAYLPDGSINRAYISTRVFSDTTLLHRLNDIIHPAVKTRFSDFIAANRGKIIIKETALLFEAGIAGDCDKVIVVAAGEEQRIQRVMQRDHLTREAVLKRMKSQLPQEEKVKRADFVIMNDENTMLIPQVLEVYRKLEEAAGIKV